MYKHIFKKSLCPLLSFSLIFTVCFQNKESRVANASLFNDSSIFSKPFLAINDWNFDLIAYKKDGMAANDKKLEPHKIFDIFKIENERAYIDEEMTFWIPTIYITPLMGSEKKIQYFELKNPQEAKFYKLRDKNKLFIESDEDLQECEKPDYFDTKIVIRGSSGEYFSTDYFGNKNEMILIRNLDFFCDDKFFEKEKDVSAKKFTSDSSDKNSTTKKLQETEFTNSVQKHNYDFEKLKGDLEIIHNNKRSEVKNVFESTERFLDLGAWPVFDPKNLDEMEKYNCLLKKCNENKKNLLDKNSYLYSLIRDQKKILNDFENDFKMDQNQARIKAQTFVEEAQLEIENTIKIVKDMAYERLELIKSSLNENRKLNITGVHKTNAKYSCLLDSLGFNLGNTLYVSNYLGKGGYGKCFALYNKSMIFEKKDFIVKFFEILKNEPTVDDYSIAANTSIDLDALHGTVKPLISLEVKSYLNKKFIVNIFKKRDSDLNKFLRKNWPLESTSVLINILGSLLNSVSNIHELGLFHGDIHLNNILIKKEFSGFELFFYGYKHRCLMCDFGRISNVENGEIYNLKNTSLNSKMTINPQAFEKFRVGIVIMGILAGWEDYFALHPIVDYPTYIKNKLSILKRTDDAFKNFKNTTNLTSETCLEIVNLVKKMINLDNNDLTIYGCKDEFLQIIKKAGLENELDTKLLKGLERHSKINDFGKIYRDVLDENSKKIFV